MAGFFAVCFFFFELDVVRRALADAAVLDLPVLDLVVLDVAGVVGGGLRDSPGGGVVVRTVVGIGDITGGGPAAPVCAAEESVFRESGVSFPPVNNPSMNGFAMHS